VRKAEKKIQTQQANQKTRGDEIDPTCKTRVK
jgi:hypothetical protein